jgi:glycosyl transferase family 25
MIIYAINMKESDERRRNILLQAKETGLNIEIIDAINGKNIQSSLLSILSRKDSYAITTGEIGCSLSHLTAYNQLLSSKEELALIIEDDVSLPENINDVLNELEIKLNKKKPSVLLLSKVNHYSQKKIEILSNGSAVHRVFNAAFSHAYIINRPAANNMLNALLPVWCVADQWNTFQEFGLIKLYGVIPSLIDTNQEFERITTITNRDDKTIQEKKMTAWKQIYKSRPFKARTLKALHLLFRRPFIKIIKQSE